MKKLTSLFVMLTLMMSLLPAAAFADDADTIHTVTDHDVYVERPAAEAGDSYYHWAPNEPKTGNYLGIYGEGDPGLHDFNAPEYNGWDVGTTGRVLGKKHALVMRYIHWDQKIGNYTRLFEAAAKEKCGVQICLEPNWGLESVDEATVRSFAREANVAIKAGCPIFLRFANEMNLNDWSNPWQGNPSLYIEKFRLVANIFHQEAPGVAMVWCPNDWPANSADQFYPGREYVDWVGVSSYPQFNDDSTPSPNITWIDRFREIYDKYAGTHPIMLSEGIPLPNKMGDPNDLRNIGVAAY